MKRVALDFDCKQVADNVRGLGRMGKWESRSDEFPFYTLGKSAYLDGNSGTYYKGADGMNLTLFRTFNSFYKEVAGKLSTFLGEWVVFNPKLALPGFHIFPADPKLLSVSGNWHLDSPHETLGIGDKDVHAFTIAVEMPTGGGGMDFRFGGDEDQYVEYNVGEMFIHSGAVPHRIASYRQYVEGDCRITLQGHIVRDGKDLIMFW
jgi:hypothetical protein|tara:strand:- start:186 stop:800 length:615 start_codon:yes stop_codon:yes gene_type:complete